MRALSDAEQRAVWDRRMADLEPRTGAPDALLIELIQRLPLQPAYTRVRQAGSGIATGSAAGGGSASGAHGSKPAGCDDEPAGRGGEPAGSHAPPRAIDLGCGPGRHLVWLAAQGWRVTGLDWSEEALSLARQALAARGLTGELKRGDIRTPPPFPAPFDLAVATRVFHHGLKRDFDQALAALHTLLNRPGHAILSLPALDAHARSLAGEWLEPGTLVPARGDETGVPHHFFTADEVRAAARAFRAVDVRTVAEDYPERGEDGVPRPIHREWLWVVLTA